MKILDTDGRPRPVETADRVRLGLIGAGEIVRILTEALREPNAPYVPVAVADVNTEAARARAADLNINRVFSDYRDLLTLADVEAVYIATPPFLHRTMVLDALAADKHVICEKPFVLDLAEAQELTAEAKRKPHLKVGCCSCRFHESATTHRARHIIETGELGNIYRVNFLAVTTPSPVGAQRQSWKNDPAKSGGGIAFAWGVYDLDWLTYLLNDYLRPQTLFATMDPYFPLTEQRLPPTPDVDGRLSAEIVCDAGLSIHWERRAGEHGPAQHRVTIRGTAGGMDLAMTPDGTPNTLTVHHYVGDSKMTSKVMDDRPPDWGTTLIYPIRDLAEAILKDRQPASPCSRQLMIHALLEALYASAQSGHSVPVESKPKW